MEQRGSLLPSQRKRVFERDGYQCTRCKEEVKATVAYVDRLKGYANNIDNLRTLCRKCYVLRISPNCNRQGMIGSALRDGIIPPNWRPLVWREAVE